MTRAFTDSPAIRSATPLLIGLVGPSGSGKTLSALRLAVGIQRVTRSKIYHIDTEANRALHYAPSVSEKAFAHDFMFEFEHVPFVAPFAPLDYLAAIKHCRAKGAGIVIVDSLSHEHEGPGGVLEIHESEMERLSKAWNTSRDKVNLAAWQKPKSERRKLINAILQMPCNFIFCYRAKEKVKPGKDKQLVNLGWQPIAGEEFIYESTVTCLLHPASGGVPTWNPEEQAEKTMVKLPGQFAGIFEKRQPLSEEIGESLARWAAGGSAPSPAPAGRICPVCQQPFAGDSWYHCPKCGGHGYASVKNDACCTACSNAAMPSKLSNEKKLANRQARILDFKVKLGEPAWIEILGSEGATCIAEITSIPQAELIGGKLKQALEDRQKQEAQCPK